MAGWKEERNVAPPVKMNAPQTTKAPCNGLMPISVRQKVIMASEIVKPMEPFLLPSPKVYSWVKPNIKAIIIRFMTALLKKFLLLWPVGIAAGT